MYIDYKQAEFNELMRNYYKDRGKLCRHRPEIQFFYRLSVVFNLGILVGFIIKLLW